MQERDELLYAEFDLRSFNLGSPAIDVVLNEEADNVYLDNNTPEFVPLPITEQEVPYPTLAEEGLNEEIDMNYIREIERIANEEEEILSSDTESDQDSREDEPSYTAVDN